MSTKIYPDSGVELNPFTAKNYDKVMNVGFLGMYRSFNEHFYLKKYVRLLIAVKQ